MYVGREQRPLVTLIDLGLTARVDNNTSNETIILGVLMDELLWSDNAYIQHPLVELVIAWMSAAIRSHPAPHKSLACLEMVLERTLEASKGAPPHTPGKGKHLIKRTYETQRSNDRWKNTSTPQR